MKRIILLSLALILAGTTYLPARNIPGDTVINTNKEKIRIGVKAGGQVSAINNIHHSSHRRVPGLTAGIVMQIPLQKTGFTRFFFAPELLYSQRGEKGQPWNIQQKEKFYHDYLSLPLLFRYYPDRHRSFFLESGPELSYAIHQQNTDKDWSKPNRFDLGAGIGGGWRFGGRKNYEIGARLYVGFLDMHPDTKGWNSNISSALTFTYLFEKYD